MGVKRKAKAARITVSLSPPEHGSLSSLASKQNVSLSQLVRVAVAEFLARNEGSNSSSNEHPSAASATRPPKGRAVSKQVVTSRERVARQAGKTTFEALYQRALPATRTGDLYGAFPYPTKISPEAIALYIAAHTQPGDTIFDGFAGSGTTGIAAMLCEHPSLQLQEEAKRLGLDVKWGARNAVLQEISTLGAFIAQTLTHPPDHQAFKKAAEGILEEAEEGLAWIYACTDPEGNQGTLRHMVWSDMFECPSCAQTASLWDACVTRDPARISATFTCPSCSKEHPVDHVQRLQQREKDPLLKIQIEGRLRTPARLYGKTGKKSWSRPPNEADAAVLRKIAKVKIPASVPLIAIPWGDLYRRGYHQGMTHLHHFYTRRNLIVFANLWERANKHKGTMRDALRFWLLSYNASHGTVMTRVVAKNGQKELVITSAQPGVLYVSGLPVEKNLYLGLRRKLETISKAFAVLQKTKSRITVINASSCAVDLPSGAIDYVFTDPPFGGNIPYAEINFINEAWLGKITDQRDEIIVSEHQSKSVDSYKLLLTKSLAEAQRVLKPQGKATLVFHSATAEVWNALQEAYGTAGFSLECAGVLEKTQGSFKQVTTQGAVRGDPILLLTKEALERREQVNDPWQIALRLRKDAEGIEDPAERTPQRLYSRLVAHFLANDEQVPVDAGTFYKWLKQQSAEGDNARAA